MFRKTFIIGLALVLASCSNQPTTQLTPTPFMGTPRPVIVDTDMAEDDWMAILYLLRRPAVNIQAITVTGVGESHCKPGVQHALSLAALAGHAEIPVGCGRETPLQGSHAFPSDWRANVDSFAGLTLPANPKPPSSASAVELLTTTIRSSPDKVTILTLGPLTNLAEALQTIPELQGKIEMVYIMGGAVDVPGNVGVRGVGIDNQTAEWNIYCDPHAARIVFASGVPIILVPLDTTNHIPVTTSFFKRLKQDHTTREANFVFELLTNYYSFIQSGGFYFWDPLAAAILTDNTLATFESKALTVVEEEGPDSGRTQVSQNGASIRVAVSADSKRFEQLFLDTLNTPEAATSNIYLKSLQHTRH